MKRELTARQAEQYGATAPATPLILEIPLRCGRFVAQVKLPLDATDSDLAAIDAALKSTFDGARPDPLCYVRDGGGNLMESPPCEQLSEETRLRIARGIHRCSR